MPLFPTYTKYTTTTITIIACSIFFSAYNLFVSNNTYLEIFKPRLFSSHTTPLHIRLTKLLQLLVVCFVLPFYSPTHNKQQHCNKCSWSSTFAFSLFRLFSSHGTRLHTKLTKLLLLHVACFVLSIYSPTHKQQQCNKRFRSSTFSFSLFRLFSSHATRLHTRLTELLLLHIVCFFLPFYKPTHNSQQQCNKRSWSSTFAFSRTLLRFYFCLCIANTLPLVTYAYVAFSLSISFILIPLLLLIYL